MMCRYSGRRRSCNDGARSGCRRKPGGDRRGLRLGASPARPQEADMDRHGPLRKWQRPFHYDAAVYDRGDLGVGVHLSRSRRRRSPGVSAYALPWKATGPRRAIPGHAESAVSRERCAGHLAIPQCHWLFRAFLRARRAAWPVTARPGDVCHVLAAAAVGVGFSGFRRSLMQLSRAGRFITPGELHGVRQLAWLAAYQAFVSGRGPPTSVADLEQLTSAGAVNG
jgi:hypothetical protein